MNSRCPKKKGKQTQREENKKKRAELIGKEDSPVLSSCN
jgi:hypothetical protein